MPPIIGVDFDNTIVCYDEVFYNVALEQNLIPKNIPQNKESVRDHLRKTGRENDWTELQGYVYGDRIKEATPYPGVLDFFTSAVQSSLRVYIISHKSLYPYAGKKYDLHKAAYGWLSDQGFFDRIGLDFQQVFFEKSMDEKVQRIANVKCTHFIDDLPEFLLKENFPFNVQKMLFSPTRELNMTNSSLGKYVIFNSWQNMHHHLNPLHRNVESYHGS